MKKNILFIVPLPPPIHGSAMVSQQIKNSDVINNSFVCDYINLSTSRKMDDIQKFGLLKIFRLLNIYMRVFWKLLTNKYDLCYCAIACFGIPFLKDSLVVLLCKLFGVKILIHQHNKGMSEYCHKPIYSTLYKWVYRSSKVMLLSWRLYDDISQIVDKKQIVICPNGIAPTTALKLEKGDNDMLHILYLSNLIVSKGVLVLLDACKILKDRGWHFVCDFVGSETYEMSSEKFEREVRSRGLNEIVVYHGQKYGKDKESFFQIADIFAFPTFYPPECFPLVLLEAMQYSLPCVSTQIAAIPDIVKDNVNGKICTPRDAMSTANCLEILLNNRNLRIDMGYNGRRIYEQKFTDKSFEKRFIECLYNLV